MKIIIKDADIRDKIMEKFIENYKQLSIIISIFHNYNTTAIVATNQNIKYTSDDDNIEKFIADEYANILSKYYNYNIILT
jgi:ATP phosphoribosyltransferase